MAVASRLHHDASVAASRASQQIVRFAVCSLWVDPLRYQPSAPTCRLSKRVSPQPGPTRFEEPTSRIEGDVCSVVVGCLAGPDVNYIYIYIKRHLVIGGVVCLAFAPYSREAIRRDVD